MGDAFAVWRHTKMIVLVALTAALYAALLIPFKSIPILPGFSEIRPANVVPIIAGVLFGPAASWGSAIGNLIGDFFGTLGPGSFFGFIGNFLLGYLPYRLWRLLAPRWRPTGHPALWPIFFIVTVVPAAACAVFISWGVCILLGLVPYEVLCPLIMFNNSVAGIVLGVILLPLIYPRAARWRLVCWEIMSEEELGDSPLAWPAAIGVTVFSAAGLEAVHLIRAGGPGAMTTVRAVTTVSALGILFCAALMARRPSAVAVATETTAELPRRPDAPAVEFDSVSFRYLNASGYALRSASLQQQPGEMRCVMGATGAGKSTLCMCVSGIIPWLEPGDFSGAVRLFGTEISGLPPRALAGRVGAVLQDFETQLLGTRVETAIATALENLAMPPDEIEARIARAMERLGIYHLRFRDPTTLSGGEKQRAAIAAALALQPDVVVLDEPTTDLDPAGREQVAEAWQRLHEEGCTLLVAEHAPEVALQADVLTVLRGGEVVFDGPPWRLLSDARRCRELGIMPAEEAEIIEALDIPAPPAPDDLPGYLQSLNPRIDATALPPAAIQTPALGDVIVEVRGLAVSYDGAPVLKGVDLTVREGELLAILGRNGSGKTTLAKAIDGLLPRVSGEILVMGADPLRLRRPEVARRVGMLFQNPDHQLIAATVREEVQLGPRLAGLPKEKAREGVEWALEITGLTHLADADPFTLPKGLRQKVALASVLAFRPPIILFDEPTTGLDGPEQVEMMELLSRLAGQGHAIVVITHAVWAAARYASRVALIAGGEILADGSPRQVFADAETLQKAGVESPPCVRLSQTLFGQILLSPAEFGRYVRVQQGGQG